MKQRLYLPILVLLLLPLVMTAAPELDIIFPHAFHVEDMGVDCAQCHPGVDASVAGSDNLLPEMDICLECHDGDTAGDDCAQCHRDPDDPQAAPRITNWLPKFSHDTHRPDTDCERCHGGVTASLDAKSRHLPKMGLCMECHVTPLTMQGCDLCHQPQDELLPASHDPDWVMMHAAAGKGRCAQCHSEDQCEDCHTGTDGEIIFHDVNHLLTHGLDYRMQSSDCAVCHTDYASCRDCHDSNQILPLWHLDIEYREGVHGAEALIDPAYCTLCHGEATQAASCDECH